jgi:DNA-binding HxlR family transcriptional regulator
MRKTYGQFCPVAMAAEIFAERWTPLIIRELMCGSHRFNELEHGLPRISKSLLVQRLRVLGQAGLVEHRLSERGRGSEYHLTPAGNELGQVVMALGEWGQRWAVSDIEQRHLDPDLLMWDLHRRMHADRLPDQRVVVRLDLRGAFTKSYWLVLENGESSICWGDPGFDVDLLVTADTLAFHRVWMGRLGFTEAVRDQLIQLDGPRDLVQRFPDWLALSVFANVPRVAAV